MSDCHSPLIFFSVSSSFHFRLSFSSLSLFRLIVLPTSSLSLSLLSISFQTACLFLDFSLSTHSNFSDSQFPPSLLSISSLSFGLLFVSFQTLILLSVSSKALCLLSVTFQTLIPSPFLSFLFVCFQNLILLYVLTLSFVFSQSLLHLISESHSITSQPFSLASNSWSPLGLFSDSNQSLLSLPVSFLSLVRLSFPTLTFSSLYVSFQTLILLSISSLSHHRVLSVSSQPQGLLYISFHTLIPFSVTS